MKKEKPDAAKNPEAPSAEPAPLRAKKEKKQKSVDAVQLPVLVELTYTISALLLILVGTTTAMISFLSGASWLQLVLRTSVALLVIGTLLVLISSQVSSGLLQASLVEQEEHQKSQIKQPETAQSFSDAEKAKVTEA